MIIAGAGTILVGLFPENRAISIHLVGAALPFIFGNIGMIIVGTISKKLPKGLRSYTILSGLVGFIALIFLVTHTYIGIGIGGVERIVSYPQSIWMILFGIYLLSNSPSSLLLFRKTEP
jgi:hypothetical membrane protein